MLYLLLLLFVQNVAYGPLANRSGSQPSSPHSATMERSCDYSATTMLPHPNYIHRQLSMEDQGIDLTQVSSLPHHHNITPSDTKMTLK